MRSWCHSFFETNWINIGVYIINNILHLYFMPVYTPNGTQYSLTTKNGTYAICVGSKATNLSYFKWKDAWKTIWFWMIDDIADYTDYIDEKSFHNIKISIWRNYKAKFTELSLIIPVYDVAIMYLGMECLKDAWLIDDKDSRKQLCWLFDGSSWYYDEIGITREEFFFKNFNYFKENSWTFNELLIATSKFLKQHTMRFYNNFIVSEGNCIFWIHTPDSVISIDLYNKSYIDTVVIWHKEAKYIVEMSKKIVSDETYSIEFTEYLSHVLTFVNDRNGNILVFLRDDITEKINDAFTYKFSKDEFKQFIEILWSIYRA